MKLEVTREFRVPPPSFANRPSPAIGSHDHTVWPPSTAIPAQVTVGSELTVTPRLLSSIEWPLVIRDWPPP